MSQLGLGVMLQAMLAEADSKADLGEVVGSTIKSIVIDEDFLKFSFLDSEKVLIISDQGQSCCESRYMSTDDDLAYYGGAVFFDAALEYGPNLDDHPDNYDSDHEQAFLHVKTSKGSFTVVNHNEHNGYYGGFWITVAVVDTE